MTSFATGVMPMPLDCSSAKSISPREMGIAMADSPSFTGCFAVSLMKASVARLS